MNAEKNTIITNLDNNAPVAKKKMIPYIKYISLVVLTIQTTCLVLTLRYSRTVPVPGPRYLPSTTVVISELMKILTCFVVLYMQCGSISRLASMLYREIYSKPRDSLKVFIPAFLFTIQNNVQFLALSNLDAATFQVTYQLKILITAVFSVIILHKRLEISQWFALVLLMIGVALVQMPSGEAKSSEHTHSISSQILGLLAVLFASFSSGYSGVYFEKLVKTSPQSLWIRNMQLGMFSVVLAAAVCVLKDYYQICEEGFFQGYHTTTWIVILLQAFGGLVVATVVKYADNIIKGFATSVSILLSTICSYYLLNDFKPTKYFCIGAPVVILATMLYGSSIKIRMPFLCEFDSNKKDKEIQKSVIK